MTTAVENLDPVLRELVDRASDEEAFERFEEQVRSAGYCERPVRLRGRVEQVDVKSGEGREVYSSSSEPDGTLLKACGQRRESVCRSCAYTYRGDAYQIVATGLRGGKGVPETVTEHPALLVTLTAPGLGAVHTASVDGHGNPNRCRPRRRAETCPHGIRMGCWERHSNADPCLGEPLCHNCFDYEQAVLWNAAAPELWQRTTVYIRRSLAKQVGLSEKQLRKRARLSYTKVAEFQRRGVIHFHAVIRADGVDESEAGAAEPPPPEITEEVLEHAVREAVAAVRVANPLDPRRPAIRWGAQLEVDPISRSDAARANEAAAYIAKYATKSTEPVGGITHKLESAEICSLRVRPHVRRMIETAWQLGASQGAAHLGLHRSAHMLGFGGHWSTKSRRYSTTFTALRAARARWALAHRGSKGTASSQESNEPDCERRSHWRFVGIGYRTTGDAWLARTAAARARMQRRLAREELCATFDHQRRKEVRNGLEL